jgi:hypothetical protein
VFDGIRCWNQTEGLTLIQAVSRIGSRLDAVRSGYVTAPEAAQVIAETLRSDQNPNPGLERCPGWLTTAFFHGSFLRLLVVHLMVIVPVALALLCKVVEWTAASTVGAI